MIIDQGTISEVSPMRAWRERLTTTAAVFLCCCLAPTAEPSNAGEPPPIGTKVGQMYPDFILPSLDGEPIQLSDYRGRKTLLIHFASW